MTSTKKGSWVWLPVNEFRRLHPHAGSRNHIYEECRSGSLKAYSLKLGGKVLVRSDALDRIADQVAIGCASSLLTPSDETCKAY